MDSARAGPGIDSQPGALMTVTVLVTGCSTGIGNSCVHREGWNVIAAFVREHIAPKLNKTGSA